MTPTVILPAALGLGLGDAVGLDVVPADDVDIGAEAPDPVETPAVAVARTSPTLAHGALVPPNLEKAEYWAGLTVEAKAMHLSQTLSNSAGFQEPPPG